MGRRVCVSTLAKVVLSAVMARLLSLMYVSVGATTRKYCGQTSAMLPLPKMKPGSFRNVADASSGHRRTPVRGSIGQNSYGSIRHTSMLL